MPWFSSLTQSRDASALSNPGAMLILTLWVCLVLWAVAYLSARRFPGRRRQVGIALVLAGLGMFLFAGFQIAQAAPTETLTPAERNLLRANCVLTELGYTQKPLDGVFLTNYQDPATTLFLIRRHDSREFNPVTTVEVWWNSHRVLYAENGVVLEYDPDGGWRARLKVIYDSLP